MAVDVKDCFASWFLCSLIEKQGTSPPKWKAASLQQSQCINILLQNLAPENGAAKCRGCNCLGVKCMKLLEDLLIILGNNRSAWSSLSLVLH